MGSALPEDPRIVVARCLDRIAAMDASIGAMVHLDPAGALETAAASARRRANFAPLSAIDGMPIAIKANIAVAGWPWTAGIAAYADRRADTDAACVARLRAAGAVLIGLTNMDEGALGATSDNRWSGRTQNPHRHGFTAGGSSGGSAAAVAAGFCVAALGTDTIGSVRIPAAYCGVMGHKPRRGAIPTEGVIPLSPTLDHVGVIASNAATCRIVTRIAGAGDDDAIAPPALALASLSLAVPKWAAAVDPEVGAAFDAMLRIAALGGARIVHLPGDTVPRAHLQRLLLTVAEVEGAIVHREAWRNRPEGFSPGVAAMLAWGEGPGAKRYAAVREELATIAGAARAAIAGCDALLCPTTPHTAFAFDRTVPSDQAALVALASCLGDPATAFPVGLSRDGLPISAQVMAGSDALCFAVVDALSVP